MKTCCKCKKEKDFEEFQRENRKSDGFSSRCKDCLNEDKKAYLDGKREKIREYNRNKYFEDHEKNKSIRTAKSAKLREENSQWISDYKKKWWAKHAERLRKEQNEKRKQYLKEKVSELERKKMGARRISQMAIKVGHLVRPDKCSKCLKECKPHGHHNDYDKPLEIRWLCKICHNHEQGKLLDVKP